MKNRIPPLRRDRGMAVMMVTLFFLLVLMPIVLVFARWMTIHRKGTTQARVHIKEYYTGDGLFNYDRFLIRNNPTGCPGMNCWNLGNNTFGVFLDSETVVTIQMTNVGEP